MRVWLLTCLLCLVPLMPAGAQLNSENVPDGMSAVVAEGRAALIAGDHARALRLLRPEAEAGDSIAENLLGAIHDDGLGLPRDVLEARRWYERSALQGNVQGQMNLGMLLRDGGPGLAVDGEGARRWLQASADGGYGPAFAALGRLHEDGIGGAQDLEQAAALYAQGRAAGDPWASEYLGHLYREGRGVPEDLAQARALFTEAASAGLGQSMNNLAYMMEHGIGGAEDIDGAESLYRRGRETGHLLSSYNLAWLLFLHRDRDTVRAEIFALCDEIVVAPDAAEYDRFFGECAILRKHLAAL